MRHILDIVGKFLGLSKAHAVSREEAYLAAATDIADLEHRMRELERPVRSYGHLHTYR